MSHKYHLPTDSISVVSDQVHAIRIAADEDDRAASPSLNGSSLPPPHPHQPSARAPYSLYHVVQLTQLKNETNDSPADSPNLPTHTSMTSDSLPRRTPLLLGGPNKQPSLARSVTTTPVPPGDDDDEDEEEKKAKRRSMNLKKMNTAARHVIQQLKSDKETKLLEKHHQQHQQHQHSEEAESTAAPIIDNEHVEDGMFAPNTPFLIWWSYLIMAFAIYNVITVSYRWAFWSDHQVDMSPDVIFLLCIDAISDICFLGEIYLNFHTGFVDSGSIVWDKQRIRERYIKSWLPLDIVTCLPFDLIQIGYGALVPAVRAPKILRLFQVVHHWNHIEENTSVSLQFRLLKLLFYTGVISHFAACIKYHVLLEIHDVVTSYGDKLHDRTIFSRYLQSLYWAAGSVTGRDDTNAPETFADVGFTVAMMLVGVIWFAYIIASLEQFTDTSNSSNARFQAKIKYVSQFMHQFQLPEDLQDKVKSYYSYLWSSSLRFETDHFLKSLPSALQTDLRLSLTNEVLERAAIFDDVESGFLAYIVHYLTPIVAIPQEIIATVNHVGTEMYFIQEGEVEILIGPKLAAIATLRQGDYFGEYCIFVSKVRTSTARSVSYSTLLVLSQQHLLKAMELFPASEKIIRGHVADHRARTLQQERNFLGLDNEEGGTSKKSNANTKLRKLIHVEEQTLVKGKEKWTISPTHKYYVIWSYIYIMYVLWNAIVIPVRFAFLPYQVSPFVMFMDYSGDVFMIIDIFLNFRVRYTEKGAEIMDTSLIARRYLKGPFIIYVISSIPLDFLMIPYGMQPFLRLNRVLRIVPMHYFITNRIKDSTFYEAMSLIYLIACFLFLAHWASCIYWSFTRFEGFAPETVDHAFGYQYWRPAHSIEHQNIFYQYLQAQFFSLTFLAGIGHHVYPPSNYDVVLTLVLMLLGVFVVSYLIGKVGQLFFSLNAAATEFKAESAFVHQLLDYRKVSSETANRVHEYMKHQWQSQKGIDPNTALNGLPIQLRTDIMMYVCEDMIRKVPRFRGLDNSFIRLLVGELTFVELPTGEFVFRQGQVGDSMYFIDKGVVEIVIEGHEESKNKVITSGSFFGEGMSSENTHDSALFSGTRSASVRARTPVRLLALSEHSFQKVMRVHPHFAQKIMSLKNEQHHAMKLRLDERMQHEDSNVNSHRISPIHRPLMRTTTENGVLSSFRGNSNRNLLQHQSSTGSSVLKGDDNVTSVIKHPNGVDSPIPTSSTTTTTATALAVNGGVGASAAASTSATTNISASSSPLPPSAPYYSASQPPTLTITTTHHVTLHDTRSSPTGTGLLSTPERARSPAQDAIVHAYGGPNFIDDSEDKSERAPSRRGTGTGPLPRVAQPSTTTSATTTSSDGAIVNIHTSPSQTTTHLAPHNPHASPQANTQSINSQSPVSGRRASQQQQNTSTPQKPSNRRSIGK